MIELIERPGYPADDTLLDLRAGLEVAMADRAAADGVAVTRVEVGGREAVRVEPETYRAVMLYFHGGGYRMGSPAALIPYLTRLSAELSCLIIAPKYRLAPENPYPAALNDAVGAWDEVARVARDDGKPVIVAGDSAGGGIAAALVAALLSNARDVPAAVIALSPWADLRLTAHSFQECADTDAVYSLERATRGAGMYLQGHDANDPLVSSVLADWRGAPPFLVQASDSEVLRDDGRALTAAVRSAGGTVVAEEYPGEPHVWQYAYPDTPGSRSALAAIERFVSSIVDPLNVATLPALHDSAHAE